MPNQTPSKLSEVAALVKRRASIPEVSLRELVARVFGLPIDYYYNVPTGQFTRYAQPYYALVHYQSKALDEIARHYSIQYRDLFRLSYYDWYELALEYRRLKGLPELKPVRLSKSRFTRKRNPFRPKV